MLLCDFVGDLCILKFNWMLFIEFSILKLTIILKLHIFGLNNLFSKAILIFSFCTYLNKSHFQLICASAITYYML